MIHSASRRTVAWKRVAAVAMLSTSSSSSPWSLLLSTTRKSSSLTGNRRYYSPGSLVVSAGASSSTTTESSGERQQEQELQEQSSKMANTTTNTTCDAAPEATEPNENVVVTTYNHHLTVHHFRQEPIRSTQDEARRLLHEQQQSSQQQSPQQQQQQQQVDGKAAPLSLQLHSCQLGAKAAILLWKDSSGQVRRLRSLLRQEIEDDNNISEENRTAQQLLAQGLHIPDILHTTVLRFSRTPPGDGAQIQANFQRALGGQQSPPMVQLQWDIDSITLVCERRPYMHHVDDEGDVLVREEMTNEADGT
mmetsp:Transcript_2355/g.5853  ORF Transcript_2355/g.5853 Transcript_2355/m.5853 type:complete len:306 (+) Transcript_2355:80-997(+)